MRQFDETMIFGEEDFPEALEQKIKPWIKEHLEEGYIHSHDGTRLHYHCAVNPEEIGAVAFSTDSVNSSASITRLCTTSTRWDIRYFLWNTGDTVFHSDMWKNWTESM